MSNTVIKVENLSKQYRLGQIGTGSLAHDINRWWHKIRGNEDPYLKVGETNDRTSKGDSEYVWSLRDINFEIKQGDAVGIIGRNGAGKSTLLKILSRTTAPTIGNIKIKGRVASLLEVGTGFHPELSGRENIFLNGAILGMTKAEIKKKFDEIVDFAGVERYVDTPVKRYSSGMYVRLAFGVAAHLEPEILIVDEVLAVGDAEFQKKALGKMKDVSQGEGRTVLFVSHNMAAVKQLCNSGFFLKNGQLAATGRMDDIFDAYKKDQNDTNLSSDLNIENNRIKVLNVAVSTLKGEKNITIEDEILISATFECKEEGKSFALGYQIYNEEEILLFEAFAPFANENNSEKKCYTVDIIIPAFLLNSGKYVFNLIFGEAQKYIVLSTEKIFSFDVENTLYGAGNSLNRIPGILRPKLKYFVK
jgi:lipopolysaccharide transport system ATP-binding protein